jgi:aspartate/methionine/tyrosine aminotransferase
MPNVDGKKFPYTPEGKAAAKKAAIMKVSKKSKGMTSKTPANPTGMTY